MSKQKNNLVYLEAYRKKRLNLKKKSKAASDESIIFVDHEENFRNEKPKKGKIYYMSNHWKNKRILPLEENNNPEKKKELKQKSYFKKRSRKHSSIINFLRYKEKIKAHHTSFKEKNVPSSENSKTISLEAYRKRKRLQALGRWQMRPFAFPRQTLRSAISFTAMAAVMLFALNIIFPNGSLKKKTLHYAKAFTKPVDASDRSIASLKETKMNTKSKTAIRSLSSLFGKRNSDSSSIKYIRYIKSKRFKAQTAISGRKPDSSDYKGF